MSSPFKEPLRLALVDAPNWVLCLLVAVAVTATAMVAMQRQAGLDLTAADQAHGLPVSDGVAAPAATAPRPAAKNARSKRELPVSRSTSHRGGARVMKRAAALPRAHQHHRAAASRAARPKPAHVQRPNLPLAPSDAAETVAAAKRSNVNQPGRCLAWSREQAGIPAKYADAATAWSHAAGRRPEDRNPPRGAAVYWTGGSSGYGHIAISVGHGKVRSSDAGGSGQVATVPIRHLSSDWNLKYAGWANSINGYRIRGVAPA